MMAMLRCTSQRRKERSRGVFMASIETDPSFLLFWPFIPKLLCWYISWRRTIRRCGPETPGLENFDSWSLPPQRPLTVAPRLPAWSACGSLLINKPVEIKHLRWKAYTLSSPGPGHDAVTISRIYQPFLWPRIYCLTSL